MKKNASFKQVDRINRYITAREVRLIDNQGEQRGVVPIQLALEIAGQAGLDLVEVASQADPPVCRVMDYGKYRYQQQKKHDKSKQKQIHVKEIKLRPVTEDGDYQIKARKAKEFIAEGDKVKISMRFRGREISHHSLGEALLNRLITDMNEVANVEFGPKLEGRQFIMVLGPKKK